MVKQFFNKSIGLTKRWIILGLFIIGIGVISLLVWKQYDSNFFVGENETHEGEHKEDDEENEAKFIVKRISTECRHHKINETNELPEGLEKDVFFNNKTKDAASALTENWYLTYSNVEDELYIVTKIKELCDDCSQQFYLGVYNDKIAVYKGIPPDGVLKEVLDHEVKEVYREELEKGVPFEDKEEKIHILESFTS